MSKLSEIVANLKAENARLTQELSSRNAVDQGIMDTAALKAVNVWTEHYTHISKAGRKADFIRVFSDLSAERGKDKPQKADMSRRMKGHGGRFFFPTETNPVPFWSVPKEQEQGLTETLAVYTVIEKTAKK